MAEELAFVPPSAASPDPPEQSTAPTGFAIGALALSAAVGALSALFQPVRSIGFMMADVTIEESGHDELEITHHPVETGASITDHAFKRPAEVRIRCGWSNSLAGPDYVQAVYAALLELQESREPFVVVTGKRTYENMLIASLSQTTDYQTENALIATVVCRQIRIASTQAVTVAPREQQSQAANTAPTENTGQQQAVEKPAADISGVRALGGVFGTSTAGRAPITLPGPGAL